MLGISNASALGEGRTKTVRIDGLGRAQFSEPKSPTLCCAKDGPPSRQRLRHPPESGGGLDMGTLQGIWRGDDQKACVAVCERLRAALVPFKVVQRRRQFLRRVERHFEIGVPPEVYSQAKAIIDCVGSDPTDGVNDEPTELPTEKRLVGLEELRDSQKSGDWRSGEATVEVWSGKSSGKCSTIESCLRENDIDSRVDILDNGSRNILVVPGDEELAKEIVREIEDGTPPK